MTWQQIEPAYRLGHELGNGTDARVCWEARNPGTWERVKDSVREALLELTGRGCRSGWTFQYACVSPGRMERIHQRDRLPSIEVS